LRFPLPGQLWEPSAGQRARDVAGRTVLAMLGLCAASLADESGLDLRSRCLLWPETEPIWTLLDRNRGGDFSVPGDVAIELLRQAVEEATGVGLPWCTKPVVLTPSEKLVKLVVKSQQLAAHGSDGGEGN
jgi:CRISPR-associated protein Csb1